MSTSAETPPAGCDPAAIEPIVEILLGAESALFITGAGVSADSGLPTYRGIGGLYEHEVTEDNVPIEVALSGTMLEARPALTWKYIAEIEAACRGARCNPAHTALAALEAHLGRAWVLTQNVDGFHRDAGSQNLIEIHGNLRELMCTRCPHHDTVADYAALDIPPACPLCGALVRPDVVLFGELLSPARVATLRRELESGFDVVVSIGTTSVFPYIAGPVLAAQACGVPTIEINPGDSEVSDMVDIRVRAGAAAVLPAVWQRYAARAGIDPGPLA